MKYLQNEQRSLSQKDKTYFILKNQCREKGGWANG